MRDNSWKLNVNMDFQWHFSDVCHVEKKKVCRTEHKEVCKPVYRKPTYQTAAFHGKKCESVPEEKCELVDENRCAKVPEKVCKKVKEEKCLTIPEETCRDVPTKECKKVPKFVPSNNPIKVSLILLSFNADMEWLVFFFQECQKCETYEDDISDVVYDKKCERHDKPKCYTAHKEVMVMSWRNTD